MNKARTTTRAVEILHRRYIGDDARRQAALQAERVNAEVAQMIYELRKDAGMTQKALADLIGTTQSVISRLEDADYEGHSLSLLSRVAKALNRKLAIEMAPPDETKKAIRFVFSEVIRGLRKAKGLGIDQLARKTGIDRAEVVALERDPGHRPSPLALYKLSRFYKIPQQKLAALAGAVREVPPGMEAEASRFAAQSDSFAQLTPEERRSLDAFVGYLRTEEIHDR